MSDNKMPVIFISHGSPMLAIDSNAGADFRRWGDSLPKPKAALVFSAHWQSESLAFGETSRHDSLIYDFSGFPAQLYQLQYPAPGAPWLVETVQQVLNSTAPTTNRGLDHGVWVPLLHLWPQADVPVLQMSMPYTLSTQELYNLGQRLAPLREKGVMIIGSGGVTHNLREAISARHTETPPWVSRFDEWVTQTISGDRAQLLTWETAPDSAKNHPTPEHFRPLLIAAGAADDSDFVDFPVTGFELGIISRRSVQYA
ncbi:MAG: dioxygenase [Gammaproteobacteria bacterium]|nr:dioxygenase [Gammaproteobacteria bacterium]